MRSEFLLYGMAGNRSCPRRVCMPLWCSRVREARALSGLHGDALHLLRGDAVSKARRLRKANERQAAHRSKHGSICLNCGARELLCRSHIPHRSSSSHGQR
jgi:hypothetical protein